MKPHRSLVVRVVLVLCLLGSVLSVRAPRPALAAPDDAGNNASSHASAFHVPFAPPSPLDSPVTPPEAIITQTVTASTDTITETVSETVTAEVSTLIRTHEGGHVQGSRRTRVEFAPRALQADTYITLTEAALPSFARADLTRLDPTRHLFLRLQPDLAAFDAPVTLTVDLSGFLTAEMWMLGESPTLYYLRPTVVVITDTDTPAAEVDSSGADVGAAGVLTRETFVQEEVPATYDPALQRLTARLAHFSDYEIGLVTKVGAPQPWTLSPNLGSVDPFRGSATFATTLDVPSLPDNTQPSLHLTYSSAATDERVFDEYRLGYGWGLSVPRVFQGVKVKTIVDWSGGRARTRYQIQQDHEYKLALGGATYNLIPVSQTSQKIEYVTESYAPLRVVYCFAPAYQDPLPLTPLGCDGLSVPHTVVWEGWHHGEEQDNCVQYPPDPRAYDYTSPGYWQVWTADGTRYVFGLDAHSTRAFASHLRYPISGDKVAYQAYYLSRVYSPLRDDVATNRWSAAYQYAEAFSGVNGTNWNGGQCWGMGRDEQYDNQLTTVLYGNSQGVGGASTYSLTLAYQTQFHNMSRLAAITTWANGSRLQQHAFGILGHTITGGNIYDDYLLMTYSQKAWNGASWVSLPATTFAYSRTTDHLLTAISNGYGARAVFTYTEGLDHHYPQALKYYTVSQRQLSAGAGGGTLETYTYSSPCFNDRPATCWLGHDALFDYSTGGQTVNSVRGGLVGFAQTTRASAPLSGAALAKTQSNQSVARATLGRALQVRHMDGASTVLSAEQTDYLVYTNTNPTFATLPAGAWFVAPLRVTTYVSGNIGSQWTTQVEYGYGNGTNGLPTALYEYGLTGSGDERSTHRTYAVNTTLWIVDKLTTERVYTGITADVGGTPGQGAFQRHTRLFYDGSVAVNDAPQKGNLTRVDEALGAQWVTAQQGSYDLSGNPVVITDANGNATRAAYDPTELFVTSVTNPLGHVTRYFYYCINESGGCTADQPWGALKAIRDPNSDDAGSVQTLYQYDAFGRLTSVIRPYDSATYPTVGYTYLDAYTTSGFTGLRVIEGLREQSGDYHSLPRVYFYDGLGQLVQTRVESQEGTQQVVTSQAYDALGRQTMASVPIYVNGTAFWDYQAPDWATITKTVTQYDALGRPTSVTGADGTQTRTFYDWVDDGARTSTLDAEGHLKATIADAYGRLIRVREITGTYSTLDLNTLNTATTFGLTRYSYDVLGSLRMVTDALTNTTVITYDTLGRKIAMRDPDMGPWTYGYDLAGNLTSQTDAKGQTLWFGYDALHRLTEKRRNNVSGTPLASYGYDTGVNGLSRQAFAASHRVSLSDTFGTLDATRWVFTTQRLDGGALRSDGTGVNYNTYFYRSTYTLQANAQAQTVKLEFKVSRNDTSTHLMLEAAGSPYRRFGVVIADGIYVQYMVDGINYVAPKCLISRLEVGAWYVLTLKVLPDGQGYIEVWRQDQPAQRGNYLAPMPGGLSYRFITWVYRGSAWVDNYTESEDVTQVWAYDQRGRTSQEVQAIGGVGAYPTTYTFDALDRVVTTTYPTGEAVRTTYDAGGRLARLIGTSPYVSGARYNPLGQPTVITAGHGLTTRYLYWGLDYFAPGYPLFAYGRLRQVCVTANPTCPLGSTTGTYLNLAYNYDHVGNVLTLRDDTGGQREDFTYDALDRLTRAAPNPLGVPPTIGDYTETYGYNAIGNLVSKGGVALAYNSTKPHAVTALSNGATFVYDGNGNMTQRGEVVGGQSTTYLQGWDVENRLIAITNTASGQVTTYSYNASGQRVKRVDAGGTLVTLGAHFEQLRVGTAVTHTSYYFFGDQRVALRQTNVGTGVSTVYWLHGDHLGSASLATYANGTVVPNSVTRYKPFGEIRYPTSGSSSLPTDRTFTGQRSEKAGVAGSLMDYGGRFYSPLLGRFISADSLVPQPGDPQSLNRYSYALGNPLTRVDPSGHFDIGALLLGIGDQYFDDVSLGAWSALNVDVKARFVTEDSVDYNAGRVVGQVAALFTGGGEIGGGITTIAGSVGGGVLCAAATAGACIPVAAGVSAAGVVGGVTMVGHGGLVVGKVLSNGDPLTKLYAQSSGPGQWEKSTESMSARAAGYQGRITGRPGEVYRVNGVKFDGFKNGTLLDAKGPGYAGFAKGGRFRSWFSGASDLVKQARDQLRAANGVGITWHVAEEEAYDAIQNLFRDEGISGISLIYTP